MTETQRHAVFAIGLTLLGVQGVERSTGFLIQWVFPADPTLDLKAVYAMDATKQKRTLGQLLFELRKRVQVHPDFDAMLMEFLGLRNRFVHHLFNEKEFILSTDESCARAEEVMKRIQCLAWDIDNLAMGYILLWAEHIGVPELAALHREVVSESEHLQQIRTHLQPVFTRDDTRRGPSGQDKSA